MKKLFWTLPLFLAAVVAAQQPPGKKGPPGPPPTPEVAFSFLDRNRDGKVSQTEFAASPRLRGQTETADAFFKGLDQNGDGTLSLEEFRNIDAVQNAARRFMQADGKAPPSAAAKPAERAATQEEIAFFESKIRPVLAEKCYKCHSTAEGNKVKGSLALDTKEGTRKGGDTGPAVVPGDAKKSLLLEAIHYSNNDLQMPPEKEGGKLSEAIIKDFERWVQMGAPDPRSGAAVAKTSYDYEQAKKHWAYQPPQRRESPKVKNSSWPRTEIDRFVLANLESKGLAPVADAEKLTLLRRVHFDLNGLPPTFDEINTFLDDKSPEAFAKVVDKLLASQQFGERWGRHWLDVARYGESSGKDVNVAFPHAWRYRDYVITAFNADKPYDHFVREQIAGDLLASSNDKQRAEQLVATGFLAIGTKGVNEQNVRQFHLDVADEQIDTLSQAFLGTTIACARCHDHKFDPFTQTEYYALAGIFTSTETRYGTIQAVQNRHPAELIELPKSANQPTLGRKMSAGERDRQEKQLADLREEQRELFGGGRQGRPGQGQPQPQANNDPQRQQTALRLRNEIGQLEGRLNLYDTKTGEERALAMGVQDLSGNRLAAFGSTMQRLGQGRLGGLRPPEFSTIGDAALYTRGEVDKPAEKVPRAFPVALTHSTPPRIPANTSGRKELATWLTDTSNPLTARVYVNRVWGWLFGDGIVDSPDNFGTTGGKPANQPLLDALAVRFMEHGWSTKKLIREIVLSRTYQLSSTYDEKNHTADPENALNWRYSPRQLDAECIRDAMLAVAGQLELKPPVGSEVYRAGDGPIGGPRFFGGYSESQANIDERHRSVYLPIARDVVPDALAMFDFAEPSLVTGKRESTSVPSQALFMLNSDFVKHQAEALANRVLRWKSSGVTVDGAVPLRERVSVAYWLVFSRAPGETEVKAAEDFFHKLTGGKEASPAQAILSWTSYSRALFASAEFRQLK